MSGEGARCGVVTGGDGLSCSPSDVETGCPSSRWPGRRPAWLLLPQPRSAGSVYRLHVFLSDALENVPKDEGLVPGTWILREALWAGCTAEWRRGGGCLSPIFENLLGLPSHLLGS